VKTLPALFLMLLMSSIPAGAEDKWTIWADGDWEYKAHPQVPGMIYGLRRRKAEPAEDAPDPCPQFWPEVQWIPSQPLRETMDGHMQWFIPVPNDIEMGLSPDGSIIWRRKS
jgi:hypothetical protein